MKLGIKVGLKSDWKSDLGVTHPQFCEFWFHAKHIPDYDPLFVYCKQQNIITGLHFWGATSTGILANLAYPNNEILNKSRKMVQDTIDVAAKNNSVYLNIHPAGAVLTKVDFIKEEFVPYPNSIPYDKTLEILRESLGQLANYALHKGVILTVESVPARALGHPWTGKEGRTKPTDIGEFPVADIEKILPIENLYFANDFGHTAANVVSTDRVAVKEKLFDIARRLAPITKLLHVSYIIAPYNGTDYHGCLYNTELQTDSAVPNNTELKELLKLFKNRTDVYALVEPEKDHPGNFRTLQNLINEL